MTEYKKHKCLVCDKEHYEEYSRYFCSAECEKRWDEKFIWDYEHTHNSNDGAICPFCGHEHTAGGDYPELYDESLCEMECDNCGRKFEIESISIWSWETKPCDDDYPELDEIESEEEED